MSKRLAQFSNSWKCLNLSFEREWSREEGGGGREREEGFCADKIRWVRYMESVGPIRFMCREMVLLREAGRWDWPDLARFAPVWFWLSRLICCHGYISLQVPGTGVDGRRWALILSWHRWTDNKHWRLSSAVRNGSIWMRETWEDLW